jgi:rhamnose utilization protein RhaD (predicted bifunctional aldolase and dehydrogenase)
VHTHPALVNGLACAIHGAEACSRLFPEALWLPYCDPGFTLSREARRAIGDYTERWGVAPGVLIIENHGVFVAGESAEDIRAAYRQLIETLRAEYRAAGLECDLPPTPPPDRETDERMRQRLRTILSADEVSHVASSGPFPPPRGPLTPDHVVYARAFVHVGPISARSVAAFRRQHGYGPRVFFDPAGVWAVGATEKEAQMALAFARDGARVQYLAAAFGGPKYLGDRSRAFIEGWEVEHYRRQVSLGAG